MLFRVFARIAFVLVCLWSVTVRECTQPEPQRRTFPRARGFVYNPGAR